MTEIVDCPALHARHAHKGYPFGDKVPKTVRLKQTVMTDTIPGTTMFISPNPLVAPDGFTYPAWTNSYGAVCAVFPNGDKLGLKPGEFEVTEWH